MKRLEKALNDLQGMIDRFREEVDSLAGELSRNGGRMPPEQLHAKLYKLQEGLRQASMEKYDEVLEEATLADSDLQAKLQRIQAIKEQADRTSSILMALTEAR